MDGLFRVKPCEQMDDLGGFNLPPLFLEGFTTHFPIVKMLVQPSN